NGGFLTFFRTVDLDPTPFDAPEFRGDATRVAFWPGAREFAEETVFIDGGQDTVKGTRNRPPGGGTPIAITADVPVPPLTPPTSGSSGTTTSGTTTSGSTSSGTTTAGSTTSGSSGQPSGTRLLAGQGGGGGGCAVREGAPDMAALLPFAALIAGVAVVRRRRRA